MADRLGQACRHARRHAGLRQIDVATEAGIAEGTVSKFEHGTAGWTIADRIVDAYARLLGVTPEALWRAAIDRPDPSPDDAAADEVGP